MMRLIKRPTLWLLGALTLLSLGVISASAAPITLRADTSGKFTSGGTISSDGTSITVGGTSITFSSRPNEINVVLDPPAVSSSNVTLGVFNATSTATSTFSNAGFTLNVTFTVPNDATPGPPVTYTGTLAGTITTGASGAQVTWATKVLTFTSPTVGTFTITLEDTTPINSPASPDVSRIRGVINFVGGPAPIPEPLTLATLGSGLAGLAALARRRRKNQS
ncbi:MAG TPA: PEP-CTERM sorting domain-containing protein [Blastocatellia bacterium]|nr:PEP-CTERM sorting domain-containing protein [Blastocatellia bacterium]